MLPIVDLRRMIEIPGETEAFIDDLAGKLAEAVRELGRRGAVVAVSGGVDSGVVAALCVRALGPERVLCLRLPERDVGDSSSDLGLELAETLGCATVEEPITEALEALGCYRRRDEAIREVFPDYEPSWRHKLVRSPPTGGMIVFSLVVERPDGTTDQRRMPPDAYRELLAATNMKQRVRKLLEYTLGRPARLRGDRHPEPARVRPGVLRQGRRRARRREADRRPLQEPGLRARARRSACRRGSPSRAPTTETFSLPQTPGGVLLRPSVRADGPAGLGPRRAASPAAELAPRVGLTPDEVEAAYGEIERRRVATEYLHAPAVLLDRLALSMCGIAGIVRPEPSSPVDEEALLRMAARDPPPRARRLRAAARPRRRPRLHPAGDLRPPRRLAAASRPSVRAPSWSTTARSTTTSSCAPSSRRAGESLRHPQRHRGRPAPARARGPRRRSIASTASSRSPGGTPTERRLTLVRDRFGVRPLHYALRDDGTLVFGSEAKALFASGEVAARARPGRDRRGLHALGAAAAADRVRRRAPGPAGRPGRLGARRDRRRAALVGARLRRAASLAEGDLEELLRDSVRLRLRADVPVGDLPLGRPRLEPDHRPRPGGDRGRAADLLGRLPRPALRRARLPAGGRARRSAPGTTSSRSGPARSPAPSPTSSATPRRRWSAPRRCRSTCSRGEVREAGITVVATGEGADELFWGYDLFKEVGAARAQRRASPSAPRRCSTSSILPRARRRPGAGPPGGGSCSRPAPTTSCSART